MGRTLPWLKSDWLPTTSTSTGRSAKRQTVSLDKLSDARPHQTTNRDGADRAWLGRVASKWSKHEGKTSSISPPPDQPAEEFMLDGLNGDDIYVMVEDEFYDVARSFTAHLHQAEYIRQHHLARVRNRHDTGTIARPVDGNTVLREDSRAEKERCKHDTTINRKLDYVLPSIARPAKPNIDFEAEGEEITVDDAQWAGTTLQGFMTSPCKSERSLVGLSEPILKCRAAAGYIHGRAVQLGLMHQPSGKVSGEDAVVSFVDAEVENTASEDDLDASTTLELLNKKATNVAASVTPSTASSILKQFAKNSSITLTTPSLEARGKRGIGNANMNENTDEKIADPPETVFLAESLRPTPLPIPKTRKGVGKSKVKQEDGKLEDALGAARDEIPTFLVG